MGLAHRVIPTLLCRGDALVKGKRFDSWRTVGHVEQAVKIHAARGVDELLILDISATPEGRGPNLKLIERLTRHAFTPITVGGGVRNVQDVRDLLNAGADKVAINSCWRIIKEAAAKFGRQAIVASVDARILGCNRAYSTHCGRVTRIEMTPCEHAQQVASHGAGEILLTSIDREGTMEGFDLELVAEVSRAVDVPVIAHGGAGTYEHLYEGIRAGASAVAAGAMFQFTDQTPAEAARYLASRGVEARVA